MAVAVGSDVLLSNGLVGGPYGDWVESEDVSVEAVEAVCYGSHRDLSVAEGSHRGLSVVEGWHDVCSR